MRYTSCPLGIDVTITRDLGKFPILGISGVFIATKHSYISLSFNSFWGRLMWSSKTWTHVLMSLSLFSTCTFKHSSMWHIGRRLWMSWAQMQKIHLFLFFLLLTVCLCVSMEALLLRNFWFNHFINPCPCSPFHSKQSDFFYFSAEIVLINYWNLFNYSQLMI